MYDTDTRVSIIMGVRENNPARWEEFHSIYKPMLLSYLRKQGLSDNDALDMVQEVFLKLIPKIGTYDRTRTRFRTWLFTVARNVLIDEARRRAAQKRALDEWVKRVLRDSPDESEKMERQFEQIHREKILRYAVDTVRRQTSPVVWACFEQRLFKDRPGAEIAAELNVSVNAVFVYACRILKKVRAICEVYGEDLSHATDDRVS